MQNLIDIDKIKDLIPILLQDKATNRNIIFATDAYVNCGEDYGERAQITVEKILNNPDIICPRALKSKAEQMARTRKKAEVFTPAWLVKKMNNFLDEDLFEKNVDWQKYARTKILEITCGEAPFLVTRYDAAMGEVIDVDNRVGVLDRKLKLIEKNAPNAFSFTEWAYRAFKSVYGYEYQGDNLLIARINLVYTFVDYFRDFFDSEPSENLIQDIAKIIVKNIWQMDGLTNCPPFSEAKEIEFSLFDEVVKDEPKPAKILDHSENKYIVFDKLKEMKTVGKKFFDYCIGNPPYQEETESESTRMPPVYNLFMDATYSIADKVELITPARFLFNAGYTPKAWNEKMLSDTHFKVLHYEQDSSVVFSNTDIKGGLIVSYRDANKDFGAINIFTVFDELNSILKKVQVSNFTSLMEIVSPALSFKLTPLMLKENPNSLDRLRTSCFTTLSEIFFETKPNDNYEYIQMIGIINNKREYRWVRKDYVNDSSGKLEYYKVILPKSNGSGALGEVLSTPLIGQPLIGHTQSFITIGKFDNEDEAKACYKYICSKFCRAMLGVLKITQDNPPDKWKYVPLQDFTENSDIDWTKSVSEIDRELYKKYGLSQNEIEFIEAKVKEMV